MVLETKFRVACFDMDGTLITNTNSVRYLSEINNKADEVSAIEEQEDENKISWIEADYLKAKLIKGLNIKEVKSNFDNKVDLIGKIEEVIQCLKSKGIKSVLVTAGPIQVARVLGDRFNFDQVYGSNYEIENGLFTGNIIEHLEDSGKVDSLLSFCEENNIGVDKCIAIGDSDSDIELFKICKKSIAINYSEVLIGKVDEYLKSQDLSDILKYI